MREIIFRGKRLDNGEWAEGFYISHLNACHYIIPFRTGGFEAIDNSFYVHKWFKVDPSTVGQYTGLKDKHGKRIFEGDILRIAKIADELGGYYRPPLDYTVNVVVKWDLCAWMWETICDDKRYITFPDAWRLYECEIIGNVHDNPELLKEEAQT